METEYEIRPAAPVPRSQSGRGVDRSTPFTRALAKLEIGQSFVVVIDAGGADRVQSNVSAMARNWAGYRGNERAFRTRREPDGIAVWRVK